MKISIKVLLLILFTLGLLFSACKKDKDEPFEPQCFENPQPNITLSCSGHCFNCEEEPFPTNDVYFKVDIDGEWRMFQSANTNGPDFYTEVGTKYRVEASGTFKNPDNPLYIAGSIQILSYELIDDFIQDTTIYEAWVPDTYDPGDLRYNLPGFIIEVTDEDGTKWTTQNDNSAGTMVITQRTSLNLDFFYVEGTFNTKLWTTDGTSLINNVTGEFRTIIRTR